MHSRHVIQAWVRLVREHSLHVQSGLQCIHRYECNAAVVCTALPNFVHHGMIYIPPGYSFGPQMSSLDKPEVRQWSR
jgi:hypothetical protein